MFALIGQLDIKLVRECPLVGWTHLGFATYDPVFSISIVEFG